MDRAAAKSILAKALTEFTARPYDKFVASIKHADVKNLVAESAANDQLEFNLCWDSHPKGNLRILASIDDGGWRALRARTDSLIMKPDGTLI